MSEEMNLPEELQEMERMLGALAPEAPPAVDRDRLMFAAGRTAAMRGPGANARLWKGLCGVLTAACAVLWLAPRSGPAIATAPPPLPPQVAGAPDQESPMPLSLHQADASSPGAATLPYWQLRDRVLAQGLSALPAAPASGATAAASPPIFTSPDALDSLPAWQRLSLKKGVGL